MDKEYINIEKELIPYRFEMEFGTELFEMAVAYNAVGDFFTIDLYKNSEALVYGEKVVYGVPLFAEVYDHRFPAPTIIPQDESGKENRVTWDNLNKTVFLVVSNGE